MTASSQQTFAAIRAELDRISSPPAKLFPLLIDCDTDGWEKFVADIRQKGQLHPIIRDGDGLILDGRNRWLACRLLGLEPKEQTLHVSGAAAIEIVITGNLRRRHEDVGSRAIHTAAVLDMIKANPKTFGPAPTQQQAADAAGISDTSLRVAQNLKKNHPEIAAEVAKGKITINAGRALSKEPKGEKDRKLAEIRDSKDKKDAKKNIKKSKPPKLRMVDPDNPRLELSGTYSTLIAAIKAIADLPHVLRNLHKLNDGRPLAPTQAWDIKRVIQRLRKVDFKDLVAAADVAVLELDRTIGGAPDPNAPAPVVHIPETAA